MKTNYLYLNSNDFDLIPRKFTGIVITGLGDKIPFLNGQTGCFSTVLYSYCMYCKAYLGCKDGGGVFGDSHGMCQSCFDEQIKIQEKRIK